MQYTTETAAQFDGTHIMRSEGETILLIEEEEKLGDSLRMLLNEKGYGVFLAANATDAIRTFMKHPDDIGLVLLDMDLSEISGESVLAMIIALSPHARVIAVTGSADPEVHVGAIEMGAIDCISKPYLINQLLLKVQRALH